MSSCEVCVFFAKLSEFASMPLSIVRVRKSLSIRKTHYSLSKYVHNLSRRPVSVLNTKTC